jgi:hypothetical protein
LTNAILPSRIILNGSTTTIELSCIVSGTIRESPPQRRALMTHNRHAILGRTLCVVGSTCHSTQH